MITCASSEKILASKPPARASKGGKNLNRAKKRLSDFSSTKFSRRLTLAAPPPKFPPNLLQRMQLRTVFRVTFCRHRRRLRAVSLYIFKFSEERARARTRVVNFVSRVFRWTSSLKPLKFLFRREKEAYNRMLRQEADHMRARGPQARVGTFSRLL